jgi:serine phosphatase RsbU (regulator of sigma subunit)
LDTHVARVTLPAGAMLLLYTDGLVERPEMGLDETTEQLVQTLSDFDPTAPLKALCHQLLTSTTARDDTTVFAIRIR